jgi:hypothetical protein
VSAAERVKRFSKSTLGATVDTVSDYVDLASQLVAEYFNQRYKITKKVEDIKKATIGALYALKIGFIRSIVEALFITTGILALVVGVVMLLSRVVPLEFVLIGYGLIACIVVLLRLKVNP